MKFTKESKLLIKYLKNKSKSKCYIQLEPIKETPEINRLLKILYNNLVDGFNYIKNEQTLYNLKITNITNTTQISKPKTFPIHAIPAKILTHINKHTTTMLTYTFDLFERHITVIFFIEDNNINNKLINQYNNYIENMIIWLYILNIYASKKCAMDLTVFIYCTSLLKLVPNNEDILDENNINTGFTRTCPKNSEIVIFRKEEWFKTFIHESFHNFELDFSDSPEINTQGKLEILQIFPVKSHVNLYEAYTEFWARIINILFCSFTYMKKNDVQDFLSNVYFLINIEREFAFFQTVKILQFMGMKYVNLYETDNNSKVLQKKFKEKTNVLAYHILTLNLINNFNTFMLWCNKNNHNLLKFKNNSNNIKKLCNFLKQHYKNNSIHNGITCAEHLMNNTHSKYINQTLRMTICELG
jgi:hypothetical protein